MVCVCVRSMQDEEQVQHQISILLFVGLACGVLMLGFTKIFGSWALSGNENAIIPLHLLRNIKIFDDKDCSYYFCSFCWSKKCAPYACCRYLCSGLLLLYTRYDLGCIVEQENDSDLRL